MIVYIVSAVIEDEEEYSSDSIDSIWSDEALAELRRDLLNAFFKDYVFDVTPWALDSVELTEEAIIEEYQGDERQLPLLAEA